ncbi:MAG: PfkB family carbohydrate kinase [Bacilli bacterium]
MRYISIGDFVTDHYYKDDKLLGTNGGMTSHNIIANLANMKMNTKVFGVCGNDINGEISIKSLNDIGVDVSDCVKIENVKTRCFHVTYLENEIKSKKRCPFCNKKEWYEESKINVENILKKIEKDDVLIFDNLNEKNREIIDKTKNIKMIDIGQYFELEEFTNNQILEYINNKFKIINLNERVENYLIKRFNFNSIIEIYNLFNPELLIVTRGKKGADFVQKIM